MPTRRAFIGGGASALALGAFACRDGEPAPRETRARRRDDRPNIVLIVIDTLRVDHAFGDRARTPNIDALARSGLSFTSVHPEAMPTVPARNSILSGRRVFPFRDWHRHEGLPNFPGWEPVEHVRASFTSALRRAGYWTAYVTDNPFLGFVGAYEPLRGSFDSFVRRGGQVGGRETGVSQREIRHWIPRFLAEIPELRDRAIAYLANGGYEHDETRSFSARVFRSAGEELEAAARQRPFALVVDTFEPHEPWTPPRRYVDMYGDPDYRGVEPIRQLNLPVERYLTDEEREPMLERMRALYAAEVTLTDRWLGVFMNELHDRRLDEETIVVLVSDHGFFLGEHGLTGKLHENLHPELTHVPLIVADPEGRRAGETTSYRASTHDVGPTLLALAGVDSPEAMEGVDLGPLLDGRAPSVARKHSIGGYSDSFYVRNDDWSMHGLNRPGGYRLYDARRDPDELDDVAADHPELVRDLYREVVRTVGGRLPFYGAAG